jgi:hypothetical protein
MFTTRDTRWQLIIATALLGALILALGYRIAVPGVDGLDFSTTPLQQEYLMRFSGTGK